MDDLFYAVQKFLSDLFGVPSLWFESPVFIVYLIVPLIVATWFFHMLLTRHVRIFRSDNPANWIISACLAFFTIPTIKLNPSFSIAMSVIAAVALSGRKITGWRLLLAFVAGLVALVLSGWAASVLSGFYIS